MAVPAGARHGVDVVEGAGALTVLRGPDAALLTALRGGVAAGALTTLSAPRSALPFGRPALPPEERPMSLRARCLGGEPADDGDVSCVRSMTLCCFRAARGVDWLRGDAFCAAMCRGGGGNATG